MGFFKKLFREESKEEKKVKEMVKGNEKTYAQAKNINIPTCNGCGQDIDTGVPRMIKNNGEVLYFHKRCIKAMSRGELPKPKFTNDLPPKEEEQ